MTSLQCKMELIKNLFAMVKPKRQKIRNVRVYEYGPFDDGDDDYIEMVYGAAGQWRDD